jgi:hypothetical protein
MIANRDIAQQIAGLMLEFGARIDKSISLVQDRGTPEDFAQYRAAAGVVMGDILLEILNPLFRQHPNLAPAELAEWYTSAAGGEDHV